MKTSSRNTLNNTFYHRRARPEQARRTLRDHRAAGVPLAALNRPGAPVRPRSGAADCVGLPLQLSCYPLKLAMNSRMLTLKNVGTTGIACRLVALVTSLLIRLALADRPNDQVQRLRPSQDFTLGNRCRGPQSAAAPSSDRWFARMPLLKTIYRLTFFN